MPSFFVTALQTTLIMAITMALIHSGVPSGPEGASVVAANVILMLPILTVVSLTEDAVGAVLGTLVGSAAVRHWNRAARTPSTPPPTPSTPGPHDPLTAETAIPPAP
ncbi:hypothetical protein [Streptomyces boluensis]|uniref:Uncharacterized protein n=1 Tax=Streptomyces boluensis TaxID=1775135 RepID=A0A964UKU0_9ACTN|nr:hypothetical protein [Streptomyces boluensis]NBE50472.1 hypothetical protein [Streptomyces boluensis]